MWTFAVEMSACPFSYIDKCYSLICDRKKTKKNITFEVGGGEMQNIYDNPTKFLGSTVCYNRKDAVKLASMSFSNYFSSCLNRIDRACIRGEYKVWIYKRYLVPSLHYKLAVERIKKTDIKKANALATRLVKKWLGLTRSTTIGCFITLRYLIFHSLRNSLPKQS